MKYLNILSIVFLFCACSKDKSTITKTEKDTVNPFVQLDSLVNGQKVKAFDHLKMNGFTTDNIAIKELHIHVTDITNNKSVFHDRTNSNAKRIDFEKYFITDTNIEYHIQIAVFDSVLNANYIDITVNTK